MSIRRTFTCLVAFAFSVALMAPNASAGPLLDWLFGYRTAARPAYPVGQPVPIGNAGAAPAYAANYGNYYGSMMPVIGPNGYGYPATVPSGIAAASAPTIMSYVPDYRTSNYRVPVTYYRPMMTTDPNTGAQVVALAPCTSYEYQTQRIPTFGYNGLLGSFNTPPVQPAAPSLPTYTLPSGGIPLAMSAPATGSYSAGYGNYLSVPPVNHPGSYSALQPTIQAPVIQSPGTYPTQPTSPGYYGQSNGGSTGSYLAPSSAASVPGLVPPPSQYQPVPFTPGLNPSYQSPNLGPVLPSNDSNADVAPSLPPIGTGAQLNRPQLKGFTVEPQSSRQLPREFRANNSEPRMEPLTRGNLPAPIPDPEEESQPKWSPGLLNERDRTARHQVIAPESMKYVGQSKPIRWASFTTDKIDDESIPRHSQSTVSTDAAARESRQIEFGQDGPNNRRSVQTESRTITQPNTSNRPAAEPGKSRFPTGGWKASK
jgi:hypothetical protein